MCNSSDHDISSRPYYACDTHPDSSLHLAQFGINNACYRLETTFDRVHNLVETPLEGCHDVFVHEDSSSLGSNYVIPNPLNHSHVSMC